MSEETLSLVSDISAAFRVAEALFESLVQDLSPALPASAQILHVGATAIPGCLTKGDLDVVVRVDRADFHDVRQILAARFQINAGSEQSEEFAAFENPDRSPHLGVQLTVKGGALDVFHLFAAEMRVRPELVDRYNDLKLHFRGKPMADYRSAKDAFIEGVLGTRRSLDRDGSER